MVPSEGLELKIYHHVEFAGKAQWWETDLGSLVMAFQFFERSVLIDAIQDLNSRRFLEVRTLDQARNEWRLYDGVDRACFQSYFQLRVTFSGRKYFESLEAKAAEEARIETKAENERQQIPGSELSSAPASVQSCQPGHLKAFVSHSSQDHAFVEKFATDLRANRFRRSSPSRSKIVETSHPPSVLCVGKIFQTSPTIQRLSGCWTASSARMSVHRWANRQSEQCPKKSCRRVLRRFAPN
jgi:hypothetical protein